MKIIDYVDILSALRKNKKIFIDGDVIITPLAKETAKRHNIEIIKKEKKMRKEIIAGNWKMNNCLNESVELAKGIIDGIKELPDKRIVVLCPPFTSLYSVSQLVSQARDERKIQIFSGAQNMYFEDKGAFTGEISADMILSCGGSFVIIGHSERRKIFNETDDLINKKVKKAISKGLIAIVCVGETLEERENSKEFFVVKRQLKQGLKELDLNEITKVVIAYEPVWAIGTGRTATPDIAQKMHEFIRKQILEIFNSEVASEIPILYGGSVKASNIKGLMAEKDIDGVLVGGASLKVDEFLKIIFYEK